MILKDRFKILTEETVQGSSELFVDKAAQILCRIKKQSDAHL